MRQILWLIAFVSVVSQNVFADDYWHASDYYTVELDGEGDAFVMATMAFESVANSTIGDLVLEIPGRNVKIFRVAEAPYYHYGSYNYGAYNFPEFEQEVLSDSVKIAVHLDKSLEPGMQRTITIIYKTADVARQNTEGFEFKFKTVKDPNSIVRYAGVDIVVPEDMIIKGKPKAGVDYKPSFVASMPEEKMSSYIMPYPYYRNAQFNARNLDPGESFIVKGVYGSSIFLLYWQEIASGMAAFALLALAFNRLGLIFRIRRLFQNYRKGALARITLAGFVSGAAFVISYHMSSMFWGMANNLPYDIRTPVALLVIAFGFVSMSGSLLGPAYSMKNNFGWVEAIAAFAAGILFSIILLVSFALL